MDIPLMSLTSDGSAMAGTAETTPARGHHKYVNSVSGNLSAWGWSTSPQEDHLTTNTPYPHISVAPSIGEESLLDRLLLVPARYEQTVEAVESVMAYVQLVLTPTATVLTLSNIAVFLHRRMRGAASVYIVALSLAQVISMVNQSVSFVLNDRFSGSYANWFYSLYVGRFLWSVSRRGNNVVQCMVTTQRLCAVVRPLHVKSFLLSRRPVLSCFAAFLLVALWHLYLFLKYVIVEKTIKNKVTYTLAVTPLYVSHTMAHSFFKVSAKVLFIYVTLPVHLLLSLLIIWALRRHSVSMAAHAASSTDDVKRKKRERQMTVTILVASVTNVALSLPGAVHFLCVSLFPREYTFVGKYYNIYNLLSLLILPLALFSYAADFVCFFAVCARYRATLWRIVTCKRRKWASEGKKSGSNNGDPTAADESSPSVVSRT